jgi:hypothetical protein
LPRHTRYWTLTGVGFNGGSQASGYFNYDDATQTILNWNIQVDPAFGVVPGFVYIPASSTTSVIQPPGGGAPTILFNARMGVPGRVSAVRELRIAPLGALDGGNATVSLGTPALPPNFAAVPGTSREDFRYLETPHCGGSFDFPRGLHRLADAYASTNRQTNIVQVYEFYHSGLRHYFITADLVEKENLDTGQFDGWQRTQQSFKAYGPGSNTGDSINPCAASTALQLVCALMTRTNVSLAPIPTSSRPMQANA